MIGQTLGNYKITQKLGAGGQGTVYKATDQKLGRTVVIKVLPAELTGKETNLKRFEREARLASALDIRTSAPSLIWMKPKACTSSRCSMSKARMCASWSTAGRWNWRALCASGFKWRTRSRRRTRAASFIATSSPGT